MTTKTTSAILSPATVDALRIRDTAYLAPGFRRKLHQIVAAMEARGQPAVVFETLRLPALQRHYFASGVSKASDAWSSWHAYGLAADVIHAAKQWDAPESFWAALREEVHRVECAWGGDWASFVDRPHVQHGPGMRAAPSARARELVAQGGLFAVWAEVGAL